MILVLLIWIAAAIVALWLYFRQVYSRFSRHGVKGFTPVPPIGTMGKLLKRELHLVDDLRVTYESFPNERFVGTFGFMSPSLLIRDIELVKRVTVKDFEYFLDRPNMIDEKNDPFFARSLFSLTGQEWKDMRATLSPAFTSSKLRLMVPFMLDVGDQMLHSIQKKMKASGADYVDIDTKDLMTRNANDVIASCAFGVKVDSHEEPKNLFYEMSLASSYMPVSKIILFMLSSFIPKFNKIVKLSIFPEPTKKFFKSLVLSSMEDREANNIHRPDMIHLLMLAKKGKLTHGEKADQSSDAGFATVEESAIGKNTSNREWADIDLVAQATLFLLAGFKTVSTAMMFILYELATNPDAQEKLAQEIKETDARNGGKFDYNSIQQMPYFDMVLSEVLRLWPAAGFLDRVCIKDYNLGKPNDKATKDFIIHKGEGLRIPVWAIHRDPEFFPNPNKFDPERFSEQNKHNIKPFTYMPFGSGPRNCIGSRFALCEVKVLMYQLLKDMEVFPTPNTPVPAVLSTESANVSLKGGHELRFRLRK